MIGLTLLLVVIVICVFGAMIWAQAEINARHEIRINNLFLHLGDAPSEIPEPEIKRPKPPVWRMP